MKQATMTDAEYASAQSRVESLWERTCSMRAAHEAAAREWWDAREPLQHETRAREIDKIVADAMNSDPSSPVRL